MDRERAPVQDARRHFGAVHDRECAPCCRVGAEQQVLAVVERQARTHDTSRPTARYGTRFEHRHGVAASREVDRRRAAGPSGADHRDAHGNLRRETRRATRWRTCAAG